jgi:sulfur carrier protein ThiS
MQVHLGGHLSWYDPEQRAWLELDVRDASLACRTDLPVSLTPASVALHLGLPRGEIALVAVNGRVVGLDAVLLTPDDRVEFYPAIGGG